MVKRIFPLVVRSSRTRRSTKLSHSPNPLPHWYTNAAYYFAHFVAHGKGYHWLSAADIIPDGATVLLIGDFPGFYEMTGSWRRVLQSDATDIRPSWARN